MSINASKTCAAKSAAKLQPIFELHNTFTRLFEYFLSPPAIRVLEQQPAFLIFKTMQPPSTNQHSGA
ncbi:MAG: hypothetical protein IJK41_04885 [Muribaculaceae bacterium]|nr:hypothetical protein [Muribaculaceae bacterium]